MLEKLAGDDPGRLDPDCKRLICVKMAVAISVRTLAEFKEKWGIGGELTQPGVSPA